MDKKKNIIANIEQDTRGSHFAIGEEYVDYIAREAGEKITAITEDLIEKNFVKLDREVDM